MTKRVVLALAVACFAVQQLPALAQVKAEDALRGAPPKPSPIKKKPKAPKAETKTPETKPAETKPTSDFDAPKDTAKETSKSGAKEAAKEQAKPATLACRSQPGGCTSTFTPVAPYLVPQWFADQEKTPQEAQAMKDKAIAYLKRYHETLVKGGGEANDVGRAYAYFVAVIYIAYANGRGPNLEQFRALVKRCQKELAEDAKFQAYNEHDKQFYYERMILIAMDNEAALAYARKGNDVKQEALHRQRAKNWLEDITERPIDKIPTMWQ
jgi:hypothetical protein